jgi:hypothetical protein
MSPLKTENISILRVNSAGFLRVLVRLLPTCGPEKDLEAGKRASMLEHQLESTNDIDVDMQICRCACNLTRAESSYTHTNTQGAVSRHDEGRAMAVSIR